MTTANIHPGPDFHVLVSRLKRAVYASLRLAGRAERKRLRLEDERAEFINRTGQTD